MGRADDTYPDREAWPGYWRAIRSATAWLLAGVVIVGGGPLLPRPDDVLSRVAMEVLIALVAVVVAWFLAARANAWWDERHA